MRQNPHVRICGGPGSATTLVYPTGIERRVTTHSGMEGDRERGCTGSTSLVIADYRLRPDPSIERHPRHPLNSQDERCCP